MPEYPKRVPSMKLECPKCGSMSSWFEKTNCDLIHRCMCGYLKVVATTLKSIEIEHNDSGDDVKLPRKGTKLWETLMILTVEDEASSGEVTERLQEMGKDYTTSDVSSYLTILRARGLVTSVTSRRGMVGGSTWTLTSKASYLLGLD
jgi:hypothetical protein